MFLPAHFSQVRSCLPWAKFSPGLCERGALRANHLLPPIAQPMELSHL